jgi:hypothetical protein
MGQMPPIHADECEILVHDLFPFHPIDGFATLAYFLANVKKPGSERFPIVRIVRFNRNTARKVTIKVYTFSI